MSFLWTGQDGHDFLMLERSSFFPPRFSPSTGTPSVFIGIVEEFEEVGGFGGGKPGCSRIILVGVILAR